MNKIIYYNKFSEFSKSKISANKDNTLYYIGLGKIPYTGFPDILWDTTVIIKDINKAYINGEIKPLPLEKENVYFVTKSSATAETFDYSHKYKEGQLVLKDGYLNYITINKIEQEDIPEDEINIPNIIDYDNNLTLDQQDIDRLWEELKTGVYKENADINTWYKVGDKYVKFIYDLISVAEHGGVPILTSTKIEEKINNGDLPDEYISIGTPTLDGTPETSQITILENSGDYLSIIFKTIRALQSEVAKLRNSFRYGINSYTGTDTAMSVMGGNFDADQVIELEPLWAILPEDLSYIDSVNIEDHTGITPLEEAILDYSTASVIGITGTAEYNAPEVLLTDTRIVNYIISNSLNIEYVLKSTTTDETLSINLKDYTTASTGVYSIITVVNRKSNNKGLNFVWFLIKDTINDITIKEGYLNDGTLSTSDNGFITDTYTISLILFTDLKLSKCDIYSKSYDFSSPIQPSVPSDDDYKYKVAHITIRSVENKTQLTSISSQLELNELIYNEDDGALYIKTSSGIKSLATGTNQNQTTETTETTETTMTTTEKIQLLEDFGINPYDGTAESNIGSIKFTHTGTGKSYNISINEDGSFNSLKISDTTIADEINDTSSDNYVKELNVNKSNFYTRGFISQYLLLKNKEKTSLNNANDANKVTINSDRVKIGAFYAPISTQKVHGCSHSFVELENTSDTDIPLEGIYLYHYYMDGATLKLRKLALTGILPKHGTYLIRGAQHSEYNQVNTFIKVTTFDLEWYDNGKLVSFEVSDTNKYIGFVLAYRNDLTTIDLIESEVGSGGTRVSLYLYGIIDLILLGDTKFVSGSGSGLTAWPSLGNLDSNCIVKNKYFLDPAKLAFQSLKTTGGTIGKPNTISDSSKSRGSIKVDTGDVELLVLDKEYIEFPYSDDKYPVSNFTPKASYEHKNVCTDKTQLDMNKPNMVTCSFGINSNTRCFNWISAGIFDEYVFIKKEDNTYDAILSYTTSDTANTIVGDWTKKGYDTEALNYIYAGDDCTIIKLPAVNILIKAHKCIISHTAVLTPTTFTYIVGRALKDGSPDLEHCSDEYTFTLYPDSYTPVIYQITDQQGFTWTEYQVWAAAAIKLNERIELECASETNKFPILINTGDMTLNGTRINEWLDYYNAGLPLFKHLELMNVVGNNDLCDTDTTILGTGDDEGKSNGFYFSLFYCYELPDDVSPYLIHDKYIPSLYYFNAGSKYLIAMVNSEITAINCENWFEAKSSNNNIYNIYTGWEMKPSSESTIELLHVSSDSEEDNQFIPIYNTLYALFNNNQSKKIIVACHEMPFTVITTANLATGDIASVSRSLDGSNLVGSHLNLLSNLDVKSNYWFSRLLEHFDIKLCIGGHKHTYAITYPIRENYTYTVGVATKTSLANGKMIMPESLANDTLVSMVNGGKIPIMSKESYIEKCHVVDSSYTGTTANITSLNIDSGYIIAGVPEETIANPNYVVYFMSQATGYKLKSNKELPSTYQFFTRVYARPNGTTASDFLQKPIYAVLTLGNTLINGSIIGIDNILSSDLYFYLYNKKYEHENKPTEKYLKYVEYNSAEVKDKNSIRQYSDWVSTTTNIISIDV